MKVEKLISILSNFDPEMDVRVDGAERMSIEDHEDFVNIQAAYKDIPVINPPLVASSAPTAKTTQEENLIRCALQEAGCEEEAELIEEYEAEDAVSAAKIALEEYKYYYEKADNGNHIVGVDDDECICEDMLYDYLNNHLLLDEEARTVMANISAVKLRLIVWKALQEAKILEYDGTLIQAQRIDCTTGEMD